MITGVVVQNLTGRNPEISELRPASHGKADGGRPDMLEAYASGSTS
jgi:hypothetical protein